MHAQFFHSAFKLTAYPPGEHWTLTFKFSMEQLSNNIRNFLFTRKKTLHLYLCNFMFATIFFVTLRTLTHPAHQICELTLIGRVSPAFAASHPLRILQKRSIFYQNSMFFKGKVSIFLILLYFTRIEILKVHISVCVKTSSLGGDRKYVRFASTSL